MLTVCPILLLGPTFCLLTPFAYHKLPIAFLRRKDMSERLACHEKWLGPVIINVRT